jgi:hypothetical protein
VNHTADDILEVFNEALEKWDLQPSNMSGITTDNASNNKKAFARFPWFPCFGHNLDLAIRKSLDLKEVSDALATLRKLISGFNRSSKRKREFKEQQSKLGLPQHQPIHDERNIVNAKRSKLTPEHVDMLTFLAKNLKNANDISLL